MFNLESNNQEEVDELETSEDEQSSLTILHDDLLELQKPGRLTHKVGTDSETVIKIIDEGMIGHLDPENMVSSESGRPHVELTPSLHVTRSNGFCGLLNTHKYTLYSLLKKPYNENGEAYGLMFKEGLNHELLRYMDQVRPYLRQSRKSLLINIKTELMDSDVSVWWGGRIPYICGREMSVDEYLKMKSVLKRYKLSVNSLEEKLSKYKYGDDRMRRFINAAVGNFMFTQRVLSCYDNVPNYEDSYNNQKYTKFETDNHGIRALTVDAESNEAGLSEIMPVKIGAKHIEKVVIRNETGIKLVTPDEFKEEYI